MSWASTSGIADSCAPSREPKGPYTFYAAPQFGAWLKAGDAIANTDYEGLGTPGVHPYLVGRSEAAASWTSCAPCANWTAAWAGAT